MMVCNVSRNFACNNKIGTFQHILAENPDHPGGPHGEGKVAH